MPAAMLTAPGDTEIPCSVFPEAPFVPATHPVLRTMRESESEKIRRLDAVVLRWVQRIRKNQASLQKMIRDRSFVAVGVAFTVDYFR
jgi:hypothetical protein